MVYHDNTKYTIWDKETVAYPGAFLDCRAMNKRRVNGLELVVPADFFGEWKDSEEYRKTYPPKMVEAGLVDRLMLLRYRRDATWNVEVAVLTPRRPRSGGSGEERRERRERRERIFFCSLNRFSFL